MNSSITNVVFIIPCYNEELRINISDYKKSIKTNTKLSIYFIDDGSKDGTVSTLEPLRELYPDQVNIVSLKRNSGKAEAVRIGLKEAMKSEKEFNFLGFLDADLATSLDEAMRLSNILEHKKLHMVFGSRISMVGSIISRNKYRHVAGRVIATFISNILKLRVYDTQCGANFFHENWLLLYSMNLLFLGGYLMSKFLLEFYVIKIGSMKIKFLKFL